jgi:hypothetical protein
VSILYIFEASECACPTGPKGHDCRWTCFHGEAQFDGGARVPATICAIDDAIRSAEQIMRAIDERWPTKNERASN